MRAQSLSRAGYYKTLAPYKTLQSLGRRDRAPQNRPRCPCTAAPCCHAGLEGWAAAALGIADLPLRWADGEIVTKWDGEEPVDFLAPGIMCAGSLGSCSAMGTPGCSCGTPHCYTGV